MARDRLHGEDAMTWNFPDDLIEAAWGLIANANGGDWDSAPPEWRTAAEGWRDAYHDTLDKPVSASPDERLREAAAWLVELAAAAVCEPRRFAENETELQWKTADAITATRAALAAADREAPDEAGRICCRGMGADGGCNICAAEATR